MSDSPPRAEEFYRWSRLLGYFLAPLLLAVWWLSRQTWASGWAVAGAFLLGFIGASALWARLVGHALAWHEEAP